MTKLTQKNRRLSTGTHWGWLLPILALSPLSLAAKGCGNSGTVGDECPNQSSCGPSGEAGASNPGTGGDTCGGLIGALCGKGEFCSFDVKTKCGSGDQTGVCQVLPEVCADIYSPVCGCDGKTYGNECEANGAGTSVAKQGTCEPEPGGGDVCGGLQGLTCAGADEYCNFPSSTQCGSGDQTGTCDAKPQACDAVLAPVCGCDDNTYDNDCSAAMAGVSVAHTGKCESAPTGSCGGRGGGTCDAGQYCMYTPEAMCGRADAPGKCVDILMGGCLTIYDPVCGCDGKTYGNDCSAGQAGMSVDHTGACAGNPGGQTCGGFIGTPCDAGLFCDYPADMNCGFADGSGVCQPIPEICDDIADPVCGCDGNSYANSCEANAKGTSVASKGKCK